MRGVPCVTGPAGRLVDAMAAVREVAGSGVETAAVVSAAGADAAFDFTGDFTGVRSLAGVEAGVALAGG